MRACSFFRASILFLAALLATSLAVGCGSNDSASSEPDATLVGDSGGDTSAQDDADDAGGEDTDPPLAACLDNTDCRGGEVCRGGFCREVCDEDTPCEGELTVCLEEAGYCVECVASSDCGSGRQCRDLRCRAAECASPADCRGGQTCRDGDCVSIDAQICTPESTRCVGNTLVTCSRDGTRETETACTDLCVAGAEPGQNARCASQICLPGEIGCLSPRTAWLCDEQGLSEIELPCSANRICEDGICVAQVCTPEAVTCEGNFVAVCNAAGTASTRTDCGECDSSLGCTCVAGDCQPRVCRPGTARCVGNASQPCLDDGLGYEPPSDCGEDLCLVGRCVDERCTPGDRECAGDTLLECQSDGITRVDVDCAASGNICFEDRCLSPICTPGEPRCFNDRTLAICDARGANESLADCEPGTSCVDGSCVENFCDPDDPPFCRGNNLVACNGSGSAYVEVQSCGINQSCTDGACTTLTCANARIECTNARTGNLLPVPYRVAAGTPLSCTVRLPEGTNWVVAWSPVTTPGVPLPIGTPRQPTASVRPFEIGTYVIQASVARASNSDPCNTPSITIEATPGDNDLTLVLDWVNAEGGTQRSDLDLHLRHPNGCWNTSPWDCYWQNRTPVWATGGSGYGNPSLDFDVISEDGAELIHFPRPTPNVLYQPGVALYGTSVTPRLTDVTLYVVWAGRLFHTLRFQLDGNTRFWAGTRFQVRTDGTIEQTGVSTRSAAVPTTCDP